MAYRKELWKAADVRCPFFCRENAAERSIVCEGYGEGMVNQSVFRSMALREKHMGSYCISRYERCPLYKCIYEEKYADGC